MYNEIYSLGTYVLFIFLHAGSVSSPDILQVFPGFFMFVWLGFVFVVCLVFFFPKNKAGVICVFPILNEILISLSASLILSILIPWLCCLLAWRRKLVCIELCSENESNLIRFTLYGCRELVLILIVNNKITADKT